MFNLLRRRVRRKHKNNKNKYNIDASASACTDAVQSGNDNVPKYCYTKDENGEHYRQISEQNDEQQQQTTAAEIALANAGASITGKTSKTTRNGESREEEEAQQEDEETNGISAGKIYFENARDKKRQLKQVKNDETQQQQQEQQWQTNDKQVHLPQTTDNFSFDLNEDAVDDHHYHLEKPYAEVDTQIAKNEQRQQDASSSKKVEDVSYDCSACGFSHNELAERQRCVLTIGEYDEILLNRTNRPTISIESTAVATTTTTTTSSQNQLNNIVAFKTIANNQNQTHQINNENVHNINSYNGKTGLATTTPKETTNEKISTINNEVKYRNLDKTSRNEAKRQSRLSFTLAGINFGRKKEVDDRVKNDHHDNNEQSNLKKVGIDIEVVAEPVVNNQTKINVSNCKKNKFNPFQKSREYFNNLFMARGRQQNRHQRHQQQQHQQQQQQSQQQQQQQQLVSKQQQQQQNNNKNGTPPISRMGDIAKVVDKTQMTSSSKNDVNATLHLNVTDSTNSYQIPLSKNNTIHSIQKEVSAHKNRERELSRSNSATHARTHSLSPQLSTKRSRSVTFSDVDYIIEDGRDLWLNKNAEKFSRTGNIERGSSNLANNTANDQFAQASNNTTNVYTHGVVGTEGVDFPTTSAFEHTNNHLIQTSSHNTNEYKKKKQPNIYNNKRKNQEIDKDKDKDDDSTDLLYTNKLYQIDNNKSNASTPNATATQTPTPSPRYRMGQTNTKSETPTREFRESSVSSTTSERDRVKKVSFANIPETASSPININLPTITVADYSEALSSATTTPSDQEVFYDFEQSDKQQQQPQQYLNDRVNYSTMTIDNDIEHDANFYIGAGAQSMSMNDHQYNNNNNKWQIPNNVFLSQPQMRHNYVKLEDVREEDENENEENNEEDTEDEEDDDDDDEEEEEESDFDEKEKRPRHLDNELYNSAERSPLKSSDTTLSGSPSDSGIGTDSQPTTPSNVKSRHSPNSFYPNSATTTATTTSTDIRNETANIQQLKQQIKQQYGFMSFVRDGNSTDCDEIPLNYDDIDLDLADDDSTNERLVCIESISLPDVVVESTAATSSSTTLSSASSSTTSSEHIINITGGASGNSMGNVHFIPIHVEGASNGVSNITTKRRSSDDSVIGNGTIEITEDACVMNGHVKDNRQNEKLK